MGLKEELQSISTDELVGTLDMLHGRLHDQEVDDVIRGLREDLPNFVEFIEVVDGGTRGVSDEPESLGDIGAGAMMCLLALREIAVNRALKKNLDF